MNFSARFCCMALAVWLLADSATAEQPVRPNVVFICVDDLKPALGCYGHRQARSPNIDRLAARGILFERAYCNQAVCAPSRNSLLTGLRPQTLGIYDLGTNFRRTAPDAITLPQWFKQHGYRAEALGKIFHVGHGNHEDPKSWSVPHFKAEVIAYAPTGDGKKSLTREEALFANKSAQGLPRGAAYEAADVPDNAYPDGALADEAILRLRERAEHPDQPFFLALGFVKPHLPFCAPKRYWDMHDPAKFELAERQTPPEGAPPYAPQFGGELRQYAGIPEKGPLPPETQRKLIHGYHAAVSYMDAQLGRVLDELDRLKLAERTIIVLWGDHGWHLGDHGIWCKHTNYEQATHIPLIIVAPGVTTAGSRTTSLAETVDLYPTLCELAGLPIPQKPHALDGTSFAATLRDSAAVIKDAIFHVYPRNPKEKGPLIGRAVRTDRYRLVEWKRPGKDAGKVADLELYDYQTDPAETRNLAAQQPETVAKLQAILSKQPPAKPQVASDKRAAAEDFAAVAIAPFWRAPQLRESMFFIQKDKDARPQAALLFQPAKILSVTSATRETVYEEGRDYVLDDARATLRLPAGSRIPFKTTDELYPLMTSDAPKIARQGGDKSRGVFFDNAAGYHRLQVEVTYEPLPGQWKGPVPRFAGEQLPRTLARLRKKESLKLMLLGDSISAGYNASKFSQAPPGCPAYGELVALGLARQFGSRVDFQNYAVGGWNAEQGLKHAREEKLGQQKPDLVLVAFGMNDVFARDAAAYEKNVRGIIETIRAASPDTEFILVASMLGNAEWGMPMEQFPQYREALSRLTGPGIALADLTAMWEELLKRKSFFDLTGNGVNHPNDFGHGIYAQTILALLVEHRAAGSAALQPAAAQPAGAQPNIAQPDALDLGQIVERHEMIPMRDGQRLSAYLYVPPGDGPWPVVFEQRYADLRGAGTRQAAARLADAGFVVALVNFRGTYLSEGTWVGYRALGWGERQDGYDTCEWLAKQPWSTGNVGTFGSSQGGYAQNFLAVTQPPHLRCQYMVDTGLSLFHEGYRIGGVTRPQRFKELAKVCRNPDDNRRLLEEWFRHPHYDDYWRQEDCTLHFDKMNVPCFTIGSWYDFMNQGSILSFQGRQHRGGPDSRGRQQLVIGPWLHGRLNKGNRVGDLTYPENAAWPEHEHMVRWFNHWLKAVVNGVEREPAVRYYVMGAAGEADAPGNAWRTAADFPPASEGQPLYLHAAGKLAGELPGEDGGTTSYASDPLHPMQIPGTAFPGAKDARSFEEQRDVLTFTTAPLAEPVEWTGRVRAELFVSSTARDTDFLVRLSDVYPDGRSILIMDYPWRARYRNGLDREELLQPGEPTKLAFDVGWISQIFNRGHRIRVTITSTGAPLYEPNPQTGGPQTIDFPADAVRATNSIHHNRRFASRIVAPVIAGGKDKAMLRRIDANIPAAYSAAVVVDDVPLVHTAQLLPLDATDKVVAAGDAAKQFDRLIERLEAALRDAGSRLENVAKLNIYVARNEDVAAMHERLAARFAANQRPAVNLVVTALPRAGALVALDAVAAVATDAHGSAVKHSSQARTLPAGSRIYVSGQAEPGTLREATRKTLESLTASLKHCGRTDGDVVQVKCFLTPMQSLAEVQDEIARYYGAAAAPPVSFVEWRSSVPIEIELVAWGGPANTDAKEPLEFLTPPVLKASPLYSRIARIHRGETIFISDQFGSAPGADEQAAEAFANLGQVLERTGSDWKHLAKATYYVTDDEISKAHNAIRPKYYDPERPPAASKAMVAGTGRLGVRYSMDLIAVPAGEAKCR